MTGPAAGDEGSSAQAGPANPTHPAGQAGWRASIGATAYRAAGLARPVCRGWRWLPAAAMVGSVPLLACLALGMGGHQVVSAVGLALLCLACARDDAWLKGVATIGVAFVVHCAVAIAVARADPQAVASLLPDAQDYWHKQMAWIQTGSDPEYELSAWVPAHLQLLGATVVFGFTSFGAIPFHQGFYEVDLMNFYHGRLIAHSSDRPLALMTGWHVWSLLRGVGYLFITFEVISMGLQLVSGVRVSTRRVRLLRWGLGLSFLLADGIVKVSLLEPLRAQLLSNLQ